MGTSPTRLQNILVILSAALQGLSQVPVVGPEAGLGLLLLQIVQAAVKAHEQETGRPIDLTKIPMEQHV